MSARAGDLELLDHPVAQRLLSSTEPAQLAYSCLIDFETRFPSALAT
ncbi:MAG TPA: hypothetical protein VJW23_17820 [Propionibacteriaceae bacterium]|nr:hypothetical protein [Propionibacteriaceae bacterium]